MGGSGEHEVANLWRAGRSGDAPRREAAEAHYRRVKVATGYQHALHDIHVLYQFPQPPLARRGAFLQIDVHAHGWEALEHVPQSWNGDSSPPERIVLAIVRAEPVARVETAQLVQGVATDRSSAVGGA